MAFICQVQVREALSSFCIVRSFKTNSSMLMNLTYNKRFYFEVIFYFLYFALSIVVVLMNRIYFDHMARTHCTERTQEEGDLKPECKCAYLYPYDPNRYVKTLFILLTNINTNHKSYQLKITCN